MVDLDDTQRAVDQLEGFLANVEQNVDQSKMHEINVIQ